jgi:hypothetical protein
MAKIKWKVAEVPTGTYRSFSGRSWPSAVYEDGSTAACLICNDEYVPAHVKTGSHSQIVIKIADHSITPWCWRTLKQRAFTLAEAKEMVNLVLAAYPHFVKKV